MWRVVGPFCLVCGLVLPGKAAAHDPDPWFGRDKALHFGVSVGLSATGYAAGAVLLPDSKVAPLVTGGALSLGLGIGKEIFDQLQGRHFSWRDLTWDAIGTATGLLLAWTVDTFVIRPLLAGPKPPSQAVLWRSP